MRMRPVWAVLVQPPPWPPSLAGPAIGMIVGVPVPAWSSSTIVTPALQFAAISTLHRTLFGAGIVASNVNPASEGRLALKSVPLLPGGAMVSLAPSWRYCGTSIFALWAAAASGWLHANNKKAATRQPDGKIMIETSSL